MEQMEKWAEMERSVTAVERRLEELERWSRDLDSRLSIIQMDFAIVLWKIVNESDCTGDGENGQVVIDQTKKGENHD